MGKKKETINDRVKLVRKKLDMTQQEFADKTRLKTGNTFSMIERGKSIVTEQNILLICTPDQLVDGKTINENWLRTGEGEMFVKTPAPPPPTIGPDGGPLKKDEAELLGIYQKLEEPTQGKVLTYAHDMLDAQEHKANTKTEKEEGKSIV